MWLANLSRGVGTAGTDEVFARSFSALCLSLVAAADLATPHGREDLHVAQRVEAKCGRDALGEQLDDALLLAGNYIYGVSRTVYAMAKTPAAKARLQEQQAAMKQRFAKNKSQTTANTQA
jgi:hypothetical protein